MSQSIQSYLTFTIGSNTFGIHVGRVVEIQEYTEPKQVPESMVYVKGLMNHRSEVIPLIDTAVKFNLGSITISPLTCTVILEIEKPDQTGVFHIGILVDNVTDVFESDPDRVKLIEQDYKPDYIESMYRIDESLVMILDANKVFSDKDVVMLNTIISNL